MFKSHLIVEKNNLHSQHQTHNETKPTIKQILRLTEKRKLNTWYILLIK